jgi:hypothetical protein
VGPYLFDTVLSPSFDCLNKVCGHLLNLFLQIISIVITCFLSNADINHIFSRTNLSSQYKHLSYVVLHYLLPLILLVSIHQSLKLKSFMIGK